MFPPLIFGTVVMVLIIACANLGTMMIARGMARRRETAIRIALGASRRDIIREVLYECALIVVSGVDHSSIRGAQLLIPGARGALRPRGRRSREFSRV